MKFFTAFLFVFLFISISSQAQKDWDLFPCGKKTYFRYQDELKLHHCDSSQLLWNGNTAHHIGSKYYFDHLGSCWFDFIEYLDVHNLPFPEEMDAAPFYSNDEFYELDFGSNAPKFYHLSEPGFSWEIYNEGGGLPSRFRISCDTILEMIFLNYTDSVKIFSITALNSSGLAIAHPYNHIKLKLSKTAGFIEFIPMRWLSDPPEENEIDIWEIHSFEKDSVYGFKNEFETYFHHFQPGDIYKRNKKSSGVDNENNIWSWDSLTQVEINSDYVKITFNSTMLWNSFDSDGNESWDFLINNDVSQTFYKDDFEDFLSGATQWYIDGLKYKEFEEGILWDHRPIFEDSVVVVTADSFHEFGYEENCDKFGWVDIHYAFQIKEGVGFTVRESWGHPNWKSRDSLLCYIKNGIEYGEDCTPVEFFTSVNEVQNPNLKFSVFPNPAGKSVNIRFNKDINEEVQFNIFDNFGRQILSSKIPVLSGVFQLNVGELETGLYFIKTETKSGFAVSKFIKE